MIFSVQPNIISGEDSLKIIEDIHPSKVFIVTDPFLYENGMVNIVIDKIPSESSYYVYKDVRPDPSQELVDKSVKEYLTYNPDFIIAFGGGSAIDLTKAMISCLHNNHGVDKKTFVAIPTTAGTGSEVTNFAVVTRGSDKIVLVDDYLLPNYSLLIPSVTKSVPNFITADTGMDVLTHALEAFVSINSNSFTDIFAKQAINLVFDNLKVAYDDGMRMKARQAMLEASCMAGIAFTNAGLGINHSIAHTIGGRFHIAHGRLNAILLPTILEFNSNRSEVCKCKLTNLAKEMGLNTHMELIEKIRDLRDDLHIEDSLARLGKIDINDYHKAIENMSEIAMNDRCTPTNPGYVTKFDLANIMRDVY